MRKKDKKQNNPKIRKTAGQFCRVYVDVIQELYHDYRLATAGILFLSLVVLSADFIELRLLEYITNSVSAYLEGTADSFRRIVVGTAGFLIALLAVKILSGIYKMLSEKYQSSIKFDIEKKTIKKLSVIRYEYYESNALYEKINLAKGASDQYANAVYGVTQLVNILLMLVVYGWMLSHVSLWFVGLLFLAVSVCSVVAASVTDRQLGYWASHVSPQERRKYYFMNVFTNRVNHQNIQTGRTFPYFAGKFRYYSKRERKNYLKLNLLSITTDLTTSSLFLIAFFITALTVGNGVASGKYEIGYFVLVIALLTNLFDAIKSFAMFIMREDWYIKVLEAYYEVMALQEDDGNKEVPGIHAEVPAVKAEIPIKKEMPTGNENKIELKKLRYRYPQAQDDALREVDLTLKKGEKIALVGENGSGKTTLISVLLGLLDQYEGTCERGGFLFTSVLQDFGQYQLTVKENIEAGCGGKELDEVTVYDILKKIGLYDFITSKPDGIYTKLGQLEKGVELSKGQWQRLAIGRLLARPEANVWILDEPTAYLDPLAEIDMYKTIFDLSGDKTVIFISHRLGFAKNADRILVAAHGRLVEDGTHQSLLAKKDGYYARMYESQKEWYG